MTASWAQFRRERAASVMRVDAVTVRVVGALRQEGIDPILLKGPTVARWLYDYAGDRQYGDSDLLVDPRQARQARWVLRRLGFAAGQEGWFGKAQAWEGTNVSVDLHTSLVGLGVDDLTAWNVLSRDTETIEIGDMSIRCLRPSARAFNLAAHRTQHEDAHPKPTEDLRRALERVPRDTWEGAAALARELDAEAVFAAGLRRAGAHDLVVDLGLEHARGPAAVMAALAADAPPTALGIGQLFAARGPGAKLRVLWRSLFPRPSYMRSHDPRAPEGRLGLAAAYLRRLVSLAAHLPDGLAAFRRARAGDGRARRQ